VAAFLVMLREGVEAALVVAIVLAYLKRVGRSAESTRVWLGTVAAIGLSVGAGAVLFATIGELHGTVEQLTEGSIALGAAVLLTWMIFWMGRESRQVKSQLESRVDGALSTGGMALAGVAFFAVAREGLESALFLISTTIGEQANGGQFIGGILGVLAATLIGWIVYHGGRRIDLRVFFRVTGAVILLFAAGLVATAVHEFQEAGVLPVFAEHLWTLPWGDPAGSTFWEFMKGLFGWRHDPSLLMVAGYFGYLIPIGFAFARASGSPRPAVVAQP
jgi:high-affinity iron transporter